MLLVASICQYCGFFRSILELGVLANFRGWPQVDLHTRSNKFCTHVLRVLHAKGAPDEWFRFFEKSLTCNRTSQRACAVEIWYYGAYAKFTK